MEKFFSKTESLDITIKKKPKQDPVGLFLERFDQMPEIEAAVTEPMDFSYLTPAQRAESMWAIFQDAKSLMARHENTETEESELRKLRQNVSILKSFYDDSETRKTYLAELRRHQSEIEAINDDSEKRQILDREIKKNQKMVEACARQIFRKRGGKSSELDVLLFLNSKQQLEIKRDELDQLLSSNPELGGLDQYQKIKEGAKEWLTEKFIWTPSRRRLLEETEEAALSGKPVLLSGESGTGKTRLVEQASLKLTGQINNLTPGKDTRFQDLIAKPKISPAGATYYEYKEIGEAAVGKTSTLEEHPEHQGRIVADDEFNLLPAAEQTERLARIASWAPGKKVRMPVTNQEETISPNFLYCAMVNLASERYDRKKIPPEVLRKFAKVDVGYLEQSPANPEIYEAMLSALLDKNGRLRVAQEEVVPLYEFREEERTVQKDGQKIKQIVNIRELKTMEDQGGRAVAAGGFVWRLANTLHELNKSFAHQETVLKSKGDAQFLTDLIIDIGTVLGWLKEYGLAGRGKNLETFFVDKIQKEFLSREAYSAADRQLVGEFLKHFNIEVAKKASPKTPVQEFKIMTPLEIGLLSPRVKYEKIVSEEPVLTEAVFIDEEGNRVEYRIESINQGDKKFIPGQIFEMSGKNYEFLGVGKIKGDPVYVPYSKKSKVESGPNQTATAMARAEWRNPETGQEQAIEINLEKTLAKQTKFYKDTLNLEIDEEQVRSIWNQNYAEIKSEVEKYGYDHLLIIPDNLPTVDILNQKLIETMEETVNGKKKKVATTYQSDNFKQGGSFNGVKSRSLSSYRLVLDYHVQNIADHPLLKAIQNKNVMEITGLNKAEVNRRLAAGQELPVDCELLINGQKIEIKAEGKSLEEYILRQRLYFDQTSRHLDEKGWTWLLKSSSGSRVVYSRWDPGDRQLFVYAAVPGAAGGALGLRLSRSFKLI